MRGGERKGGERRGEERSRYRVSSQPSHPDTTQQPSGSRACAPDSGIRHHHLSSVSPRHLPPAPQWSPSLSHTICTTEMPLRPTTSTPKSIAYTQRTYHGTDMPPPSLHSPRESRSRPLPPARGQRARGRNRCKKLPSQMIVRYQSHCSQLTGSVQHGQKVLSIMPPRHMHTLPDTAIATTPRTFTAHFWTCAGLHHHPRLHPHSNSEYRPLKNI